ncbi:hypothetical protein KY289_008312 [Solanum tuberosum]|nr:hypothetical protein KY289_008312 [Solanum tuberosum]
MTHVKLRIVQLRRKFSNLRDFCTSTLLLFAISPLTCTRSSVIFQTFAQLKLSSTPIFSVMALTIVTLQFHYGGCFVSDPTLRVNKKGTFYMLNTDSDVLNFLNGLKGDDFVDVYVVHPISIPLVVKEILVLPNTNVDVSSSPQQDNVDVSSSPHKNRVDLSSSPQIDRADVSSSQPFDENENRDLNQNQSHLVEEKSPLVEEQAPAPRIEEHSDSDSLYDVDENIDDLSDLDEELLQVRQSNIQEQVKEKTDRVNLDEIPSGPVGDQGEIEGNLGGDDPYFDSSDPDSEISEDEGDHIENDEMVDPVPRKENTKIYFDPTAKKKNVVAGTSVATARTNAATSNVAARTSAATAGTSVASAVTSNFTNAAIGIQLSVNAGPSAGGGRPTSTTSSDVRQLSTQQSTSRAVGQKRKTSTALRGGATLAYKKPRLKKAKTAGYGLLFGSGASVTERSGNTDRVLHSATSSSSTPTNIDLGYKPNGLRWKRRPAITQRQIREESNRSTQGTH